MTVVSVPGLYTIFLREIQDTNSHTGIIHCVFKICNLFFVHFFKGHCHQNSNLSGPLSEHMLFLLLVIIICTTEALQIKDTASSPFPLRVSIRFCHLLIHSPGVYI